MNYFPPRIIDIKLYRYTSSLVLSVWGKLISFYTFIFYVLICVLLEGVIDSFLLPEDEPPTLNIDKVMGV